MRLIYRLLLIFIISFIISGCETPLTHTDVPRSIHIDEKSMLDDPGYDRLFDPLTKKQLVIEVSALNLDYLDDKMNAYYQQFGSYRDDTYISANVVYEDDLGVISVNNIGFRTRGNLSRNALYHESGELNLNHFKLKFNETFGASNSIGYFLGLEEIDLKYNRNRDETYMNELGSLQMYEAFDVFAQKASLIHVSLKIDDQIHPMGVMTAFEPIDYWFLARRFEGEDASGDLYKALWQQYGPASLKPLVEDSYGIKDVALNYRPAYDLKTNKDVSNHDSLINLIEVLNHQDKSFVEEGIETFFDMEYLARFFAVSLVLGNPDDFRSMGNNYYLYYAPVSKKYYIIPYDLDHSLGTGWGGDPTFSNQLVDTEITHMNELSEALYGDKVPHPLIEQLFLMPSFKNHYESSLETVVTSDIFTIDHFEREINIYRGFYQELIALSKLDVPFGLRDLEHFITLKKASVLNQIQP